MGNYKNIYRTDPYVTRVNILEKGVKNLSVHNFSKDFARTKLEKEIGILQNREQQIFKTFNVKTAEELQNKMTDVMAETKELYGTGMMQNFVGYLLSDQVKTDKAFSENTYRLLEQEVLAAGKIADSVDLDDLKDIFFSLLNESLSKSSGFKFSSTQAFSQGQGVRDIINPLLLTPHQRKRIEDLIGNKLDQKVEAKKQSYTTYFSITKKKKASELSDQQIKNINKRLKTFIVNNCPSIKNKQLLMDIIDYIVSQKLGALITGRSVSQVKGILGEIQGMYIFCSLTNTPPGASIKWTGGLLNNGSKQFHRDLLVNGFGVQVKNTGGDVLKDYEYDIGFWENKLDSFLNKLNLSGFARDIFEMYFATYCFNIPYIRTENNGEVLFKKADRADETEKGAEFNASFDQLRALQKDIDVLLSMFASSFLYMNVGTPINADRNLLYLVGGTALVSASEILTHIKNELMRAGSTPIKVTASVPENNVNIVTALNNNPLLLQTQSDDDSSTENLLAGITVNVNYKFRYSNFRR